MGLNINFEQNLGSMIDFEQNFGFEQRFLILNKESYS